MLETAMWGPQEWVRCQGSEHGANPESLQAPSPQELVVMSAQQENRKGAREGE